MGMALLHIVQERENKRKFHMGYRRNKHLFLAIFLNVLLVVLLRNNIEQMGKYNEYRQMELTDSRYRNKFFSEEMWEVSRWISEDGKALLHNVEREIVYFPVPESAKDPFLTVSFVDTWQAERNYQGKRGHEGTDIMAGENVRGVYPVVSMTDGTVANMGWLERGGYRIGINSDSGTYYYYAHLDSYADLKEGDKVKAGQLLGYMGDSGYGPEGTRGQFAVHLHVGIYIYRDGEEISLNPYYVLSKLEERKLKYAYSQ